MKKSMTTIRTPEGIPTVAHCAALVFKTKIIQHEGDERSRNNPGHGYPARAETVHIIEYVAFSDSDEMKEWITKAEGSNPKPIYKVIQSRPFEVKLSTLVDFRFTD
jgi:hypothetical protein